MDPGKELVLSWGRGGWSQVCQGTPLPLQGYQKWGGHGEEWEELCTAPRSPSPLPGEEGEAGSSHWLFPVLPSYFSPFYLITETEISGVLFPPGCILCAASLQRMLVLRLGLWWWEMPHAGFDNYGSLRETWQHSLPSSPWHQHKAKFWICCWGFWRWLHRDV